jgi:hypothetical protein
MRFPTDADASFRVMVNREPGRVKSLSAFVNGSQYLLVLFLSASYSAQNISGLALT